MISSLKKMAGSDILTKLYRMVHGYHLKSTNPQIRKSALRYLPNNRIHAIALTGIDNRGG